MPTPNTVNLRKFINGIQVIAKLEHVDLSPGGIKTGDNWHVEGALVGFSPWLTAVHKF